MGWNMIYPHSREPFSMETFKRPGAEYRGVPFWAWNTKMTEEDVRFCLETFKKMGMGGGFLHSRTGMNLPYLGKEFMDLVVYAGEEAKKLGLKAWLYDEDRWPSGFAGGYVTQHREYRSRFLVWSPRPYLFGETPDTALKNSTSAAVRSGDRQLLGVYQVTGGDGWLKDYRRISEKEPEWPEGIRPDEVWWAYLEVCGDNPWFNGQSYVDALNPEAVGEFIRVTYEAYGKRLGDAFGTDYPAIFTDEPQFTPKQRAGSIDSREEVILPFTDRLLPLFEEEFGYDLLDRLPELFYDRKEVRSEARYHYHELVSRMFAESYSGQIGAWCEEHGIALTGHLMKEPLLSSQTEYVGEAMRSYPGFQIPGIDILCDRHEFTTAKQAQSVKRQCKREAMISELYGVTNWDYEFRGHKLQGDWQAALGVTLRAPHLAWTSMEGEAKRDYPASICYQSPWYQEYKLIEDYFARLASVLSRGKDRVRIGVIHPVESCWLCWGTKEKTGELVKELDEQFLELTDWLLEGLLDFDFISESLLPGFYGGCEDHQLLVGCMKYDVVLVPNLMTVRSTTLGILKEFKENGGRVLAVGRLPEYVDGKASDPASVSGFANWMKESCEAIPYQRTALLKELREYADLEAFYGDYERADDLLCQVREEEGRRWVFLASRKNPENKDMVRKRHLKIKFRGAWNCRFYNALDGSAEDLKSYAGQDGTTVLEIDRYDHDSFLFELTPFEGARTEKDRKAQRKKEQNELVLYETKVPVTLSEPNVLVLDMPEFSFEGQPWQEREEILRLDNRLRNRLGFPLRMEAWKQPWVREKEARHKQIEAGSKVELRYFVHSEYEAEQVSLALEQPEETAIFWNGYPVIFEKQGWYVDRRIPVTALGSLEKGVNELCLVREFHEGTNLEAVYLLGDFGVRVTGRRAVVTAPVRELSFGDWTVQGLPFYGGNVCYRINITGDGRPVKIRAEKFAAPLLRVDYQGKKQGVIAFSPYELTTEPIGKGEQCIELTAFGSRINTFGALHNCDSMDNKAAPGYWRTAGCAWSYEYCLRPAGILKAPEIER